MLDLCCIHSLPIRVQTHIALLVSLSFFSLLFLARTKCSVSRYSAVNPREGEIEKICTYHPLLTFTHLLKSVDPSKVPTNQYIHTIYTHQSLSSWFYSSVELVYSNFRTLWYGRSHKSQNFEEICTLFIQQISRNFELCF